MRLALLLSLSVALLPARAESPPSPAPVPAPNLAPLAFQQRLLANGLTVISLADRGSPTVAVQLWYRVGSKDDPAGRSGFAHLFEHLMFKRTKFLADEQFDRLTEDVGGANNATTSDDATSFLDVVPSNHLQRLLWAEAERLQHLTVDAANFTSERAVVEEEFRSSVLTPPYGRLFHQLQQETWRVHPYRRPTIGSIEDLEAATLADVRAFHATYYRPDNAALIVAGDFDQASLDAWVDRYFGPIKPPATAIPRITAIEPERSTDRRVEVQLANVPLPALGLSWLGPKPDSADAPALELAVSLLADGESSRLHQALVYRLQIAQSVDLFYEPSADRGAVYAAVLLASGQRIARAEQALLAEIRRLAGQPIPPAELDKAKTLLLTRRLAEREASEGRASALGAAWIRHGDAAAANRELVALMAVSAADIQRVVKATLIDGKRLSLDYLPAPADGGVRP